jgi:hypothetical protein
VLPLVALAISATATTLPATPISEIDLDSQEDGWTDERVLMAAAMFLLLDDDD